MDIWEGKEGINMASFPGMNRLDSFTVSILHLVKDSIQSSYMPFSVLHL